MDRGSRRTERALGRLLRLSLLDETRRHVEPEVLESLADLPSGAVLERVRFHAVPGYVYRLLKSMPDVPARPMEDVASAYYAAVGRHLQASVSLTFLSEVLPDVRWLIVKGPALTALAHGQPGLRDYGDIDVLVGNQEFPIAVRKLEGAGAEVLVHDWGLWLRERTGEVTVRLPTGAVLDLHWHLTNSPRNRARFPLAAQPLIERSVPFTIGSTEVRTLSPEDTLVHLLSHTATSGANRLVWLKDIERTMAASQPNLDTVIDRCRRAGTELLAATVLDKVATTLECDDARDLAGRLAGRRAWRLLGRAVTQTFPPERAMPGRSFDRMFSRSAGRSSLDSVRELTRKALMSHPGGHLARISSDDDARDDYLDWVSRPST